MVKNTLLFFLSFLCSIANAQPEKEFSSQSYSVTEGLFKGMILDMAEDGTGFLSSARPATNQAYQFFQIK
jgi:hypothetical protein